MSKTIKPFVDSGAGLEAYLAAGEATTRDLLEAAGPPAAALLRYDAFFRDDLWRLIRPPTSIASVLFMNAYMLFLNGARTALSGHAAAVFPTLRTALESACYGLLIMRDTRLGEVWANRHRSEADHRACRSAFTVAKACAQLKTSSADVAKMVQDFYAAAIDHGAHPNLKGVFTFVSVDDDRDDGYVAVNLGGLYGADHRNTAAGIMACLDLGLATLAVIILAAPDVPDEAVAALQALNDLKNEVQDGL